MARNPLLLQIKPIDWGFGRKRKRKPATKKKKLIQQFKRKVYTIDFYYLMQKQKGLCANRDCAKLNRVRQPVSSFRDIDHKIPIRLWELMRKSGNPNARSNLQLLCPSCHRYKTAKDRKKIALYRKKHGIETKKKKKKEEKVRAIVDALGRTKLVPKSQARQRVNLATGEKEWYLKTKNLL